MDQMVQHGLKCSKIVQTAQKTIQNGKMDPKKFKRSQMVHNVPN